LKPSTASRQRTNHSRPNSPPNPKSRPIPAASRPMPTLHLGKSPAESQQSSVLMPTDARPFHVRGRHHRTALFLRGSYIADNQPQLF
jgi:hypothetical protein